MIEGYTFQSTTFRKIAARKQRAARKKGLERGLQEGREQGLQEGLRAGRQKGLRAGRQKGLRVLQTAALELARAKLPRIALRQEAAIRSLSDEPQLTSLIVSLGKAADAAQARAALTRVVARRRAAS